MNIPPLLEVSVAAPTTLVLKYDDGSVRNFDCAPYLSRGVFVRLQDESLFRQAHLAHGTVCWPGNLDIAPETLYLRSTLVSLASAAH